MIEIIKKRFPEVVLIVGFQVGLLFLTDQITNTMLPPQGQAGADHTGNLPVGANFVLGMGIAICFIVWQMLQLGFLRTAFTDGTAQQEPKTLVVVGKGFFWRMFRFQIVFGIVYLAITSVIFSLIASAMYKDVPIADLPDWIAPLISSISMIILIKPILFCPAIMIVSDCMVKDSFNRLKNFKPLADSRLLRLFITLIAAVFAFSMIETLTKAGSIGHHLILAIRGITTSSLWLIVLLYTIKFIADATEPITEPAEVQQESDVE